MIRGLIAAVVLLVACAHAAAGEMDMPGDMTMIRRPAVLAIQPGTPADQTAAINTAITAVVNHGGGTLMLPCGTIRVGGTGTIGIVMASHVHLQGCGEYATTLQITSSSCPTSSTYPGTITATASGITDFTISDLQVDFASCYYGSTWNTNFAPIWIQGASHFRVNRVSIINAGTWGILGQLNAYGDVSYNDISAPAQTSFPNTAIAMLFNSIAPQVSINVEHNTITNMAGINADVWDSSISFNHIYNFEGGAGISVLSLTENHDVIEGNVIEGEGRIINSFNIADSCIEVWAAFTRISDNIVQSCPGDAISSGNNYNTYSNNTIFSAGSAGQVGLTASFSGTTMTVTADAGGFVNDRIFVNRTYLVASGVPAGTLVTSQTSGTTGETGTYTISNNVGTIGSESVTGYAFAGLQLTNGGSFGIEGYNTFTGNIVIGNSNTACGLHEDGGTNGNNNFGPGVGNASATNQANSYFAFAIAATCPTSPP